jgi:hypothetical protein
VGDAAVTNVAMAIQEAYTEYADAKHGTIALLPDELADTLARAALSARTAAPAEQGEPIAWRVQTPMGVGYTFSDEALALIDAARLAPIAPAARSVDLCHICKREKTGEGEWFCSYPHPTHTDPLARSVDGLSGDLDRVVALSDAATPGPWRWSENGNVMGPGDSEDDEVCAVYTADELTGLPNAPFIIDAANFIRKYGRRLAGAKAQSRPARGSRELCDCGESWAHWPHEFEWCKAKVQDGECAKCGAPTDPDGGHVGDCNPPAAQSENTTREK